MKKEILLFLPIVAMVALSGCIQIPELFPEDLTEFKDCGNSKECITEALDNCEKAFVTTTEGSGGGPKMTSKIVVYGIEQEMCKAKFKIENVDVSEVPPESAAMAQLMVVMLQGKEMVCMLPPDKANAIEVFQGEEMFEYCSGSLIDTARTFQGGMATTSEISSEYPTSPFGASVRVVEGCPEWLPQEDKDKCIRSMVITGREPASRCNEIVDEKLKAECIANASANGKAAGTKKETTTEKPKEIGVSTIENPDGTVTTTTLNPDGTVTTTTIDSEGAIISSTTQAPTG